MTDTEKTVSDEQLKSLLEDVSQDRFAPFFDQRVMAAIRREEEAATGFVTVQFAEFLSAGFRRLAMPLAAACLMIAVFNVQTASNKSLGTSPGLLEAAFGIPGEDLDAALILDLALTL